MLGDHELALGRLVVAREYDIGRDPRQRAPQELRRVFLDLDDVGEVLRVVVRGVLALAAVAEGAAVQSAI